MKKFTTKDVSEELGVSADTVRRWIREGELDATNLGKSYHISASELNKFLKSKGYNYSTFIKGESKSNKCYQNKLGISALLGSMIAVGCVMAVSLLSDDSKLEKLSSSDFIKEIYEDLL